jgi:hypothetical protein
MRKLKYFNMNGKNDLKSQKSQQHFKKFKSKYLVLIRFECISFLNFSFDDELLFILILYCYDMFLNSHFLLYLHDRCSVIISKVHYASILS